MISDRAIVETETMGNNVRIMEFAVVRQRVMIGNDVIIHPNVVIESGVAIDSNVEIFPGTYIGKVPKGIALARHPEYKKHVVIGANCCIGPNAVIFYDVEIGENTLVGDGASIREQCRIGSNCIISRYVTINYSTTIGNGTKIMDLTHITGKCKIGSNVFVGPSVASANDNAIGKLEYEDSRIKGATIEDGASIGIGVVLLPNTTIGENAVVGAGSVVTKNVPESAVVMGIPAKVIRYIAVKE